MEPAIPIALFEQLQTEAEGLVQHHIRAYETYALHHQRRLDKQRWHRVKGDQQLCVYRRRRQREPNAAILPEQLLGLGTLHSTLEDVVYGLLAPTAVVMRTSQAYAGEYLADAAVLATLVRPTAHEPLNMVSLKWWLQRKKRRRPWKQHEHREFVVLESIGIRRSDYSGDRIGFRLLHSVDLPVAYSSSLLLQPTRRAAQYKRVERGRLSSCFLFRRVGAGMVDCFLRGTTDPSDQPILPLRWRKSLRQATIVNEMLQICAVVLQTAEMNKLTHFLQQLVARHPDETKRRRVLSNVASCEICLKDFALWAARHRCQLCPQVVCSRCQVERLMVFPGLLHSLSRKRVHLCSSCIHVVRAASPLGLTWAPVSP